MPGIVPMIASANTRVIGETVLALPDPERATSDPIFRPGFARHATATLILLQVQAIAPLLAVRAPAISAARRIEVPPLGTSSISTLLELSPLPFGADARALFAALGGIPTFYLGFAGSLPADDDLVALDAQLGTLTGTQSAFLGAVLPDGVTRAPAGWIDLIARIAGDQWATLLNLFADDRRIIVVDHAGRLNDKATSFQIRQRRRKLRADRAHRPAHRGHVPSCIRDRPPPLAHRHARRNVQLPRQRHTPADLVLTRVRSPAAWPRGPESRGLLRRPSFDGRSERRPRG